MRNPLARKPEDGAVAEQPQRSRFQMILDEYSAARDDFKSARGHLDRAAHHFSTLMMDADKGINYINNFIRDLSAAIHEANPAMIESDIEQQIAEFIPKNIKPEEN